MILFYCLVVALTVLCCFLYRLAHLRQQCLDTAYQCLRHQRSAYRAQNQAAVDRFACAIVMLDTQLAKANALLAAMTVEYAQTAEARDYWYAQYVCMSDEYDMVAAGLTTTGEELAEETTAKEAWESFALGQEVLFECLNEEDWEGAQNAVEAIGSSRCSLQELGEYDE